MRIKLILLSFILLSFASCASTDFKDSDGELLTADNSVLIYGYIENVSNITFLKQSPTFDYELIEGYASGDCFVLKTPVPEDSELKLISYETSSFNFFTGVSKSALYYYSMTGADIKLTGTNIFYFCLKEEDSFSSRKEREALDYALSKYGKTDFKNVLTQRLGELKK